MKSLLETEFLFSIVFDSPFQKVPFLESFRSHSDHLKFDILGQHLLWKVHELAIDDGQGAHLFLLPLIAFYRSSIFLPPIDCIQLFIRARSPETQHTSSMPQHQYVPHFRKHAPPYIACGACFGSSKSWIGCSMRVLNPQFSGKGLLQFKRLFAYVCPKGSLFLICLTDCLFDGFSWSDVEKEEEGLGKGKGRYLAT